MTRYCIECGLEIPAARLLAIPSATLCRDCQEDLGDVFRYRGSRAPCTDSEKHFGGVEASTLVKTEKQYEEFKQVSESFRPSRYEEELG